MVEVILALQGSITTRQKDEETSSIDCSERGSHAREV